MPSKNSVNKPKAAITRQRKSITATKRRQQRARSAVTTIKNSSGSTAIVSLSSSTGGGVLVNTVISKKKAKKVERNMKYAAARARVSATGKEKKKLDAEMRVDEEVADKENVYRAALWNLVENVKVNGVPLTGVAGQGTTLGNPLF